MIRKTTDKSRGVRLGNFVQIRTIIDEELEGVWEGRKQPKEALDDGREARQRAARTLREGQQGLRTRPIPSPHAGRASISKQTVLEGHGKTGSFQAGWLPWVLIAPQMAVILVFFFWPAGQALYQSVLQQDAFG